MKLLSLTLVSMLAVLTSAAVVPNPLVERSCKDRESTLTAFLVVPLNFYRVSGR